MVACAQWRGDERWARFQVDRQRIGVGRMDHRRRSRRGVPVVALGTGVGSLERQSRVRSDRLDFHRFGTRIPDRIQHFARPADCDHASRRVGRESVGADLRHRLHARRQGGDPLLRLHVAVHCLDAWASNGRQRHPAVRLLGVGRDIFVPANRILDESPICRRGCQESIPDDSAWRFRLPARHPLSVCPRPNLVGHRHTLLGDRRRHDSGLGCELDCGRIPARCDRQVGTVPAAFVATGRDGGSDLGISTDSLRDDGYRRRVPSCALLPAI